MRRASRRHLIGASLAATLLALTLAAPAVAMAASSFSGGADQFATAYVNDHTAFAVHFATDSSSGLTPNSTYRLKVRMIPGLVPAGSANRCYTYNPVTSAWVQERDNTGGNWSKFPTVTTDAQGAIPFENGWVYAKFGDDGISGTYHLMISLSATAAATYNTSAIPTVTILAATQGAAWVHNGIATGAGTNLTVRASDYSNPALTLGLVTTEPNGVDDDSDGIVDDEDCGPAGLSGDFRMGVPAGTSLRLLVNGSEWPSASGFRSGPADTDIALGASDMTPPSSPGFAWATSGDGTATVSWSAAIDDNGVTGYRVYRWMPLTPGVSYGYSPVHELVKTLGPSSRSFTDTDLTNGQTYCYEVRAVDAATNVGPRSVTATATPQTSAPVATMVPTDPDGENGWYVTAPTVTLSAGSDFVCEYSFDATPSIWTTYTSPFQVPQGVWNLSYRSRSLDGSIVTTPQTLPVRFDTTPPSATATAPLYSVLVSANRSFTVSWSGTDTLSGAARYDVEARSSSSSTWVVKRSGTQDTSMVYSGSSGGTYYFRVRAIDAAGNDGAWVYTSGTSVPYDQSKASYSSGWYHSHASSSYLGYFRYTKRYGASAKFRLSKGTLYAVVNTGTSSGKFAVYWRGRRVAIVNTYSRSAGVRKVFKLVKFTGSSASYATIKNLATHGHPKIQLDGFIVR